VLDGRFAGIYLPIGAGVWLAFTREFGMAGENAAGITYEWTGGDKT